LATRESRRQNAGIAVNYARILHQKFAPKNFNPLNGLGFEPNILNFETPTGYRREVAHFILPLASRSGGYRISPMAQSDTVSSSAINWSIVIPAIAAIIAALIALLSNIYATYITGTNQIALEKQRLRENLTLESVKTSDKNKAIENLQFFLDAGFIDDPGGKILSLIKEKRSPVLPSSVIGVVTDCMAQCGVRMNRAHPVDTQPYQIRYGVIEVTIAGQFDWNLL
jgi:hypothetical protein